MTRFRKFRRIWRLLLVIATDLPGVVQRFDAKKDGGLSEFLFDAKQLIVLGDPVSPRGRSGLDLSDTGGNGEVCDESVLGFAAAVGDDAGVAIAAGKLNRFERLADRADLVDLDKNRIGN